MSEINWNVSALAERIAGILEAELPQTIDWNDLGEVTVIGKHKTFRLTIEELPRD